MSGSEPRFETTCSPAEADVATVRTALRAFNRLKAGKFPEQQLAVFARDRDDRIVGGATGEVTWGWLFVSMLWVHGDWRGRGIGARLLQDIEHAADRYEVTGYHLGTTSFQALEFYRRCGYALWGELPDYPPGHVNYSLFKHAVGHDRRATDGLD